jgi:poly-gamma-glutamate capsule biosynthesis protein CapA/YwtB (metallophosphatase superfamily)
MTAIDSAIDLVFAGDLVLDEPDPDHWLGGIAAALRTAHVAIGHLEVPHSRRGVELKGDVPAPGADPAHLAALQRAGFDAVTLGGNHIADLGAVGIADTRAELLELGIRFTGAGSNLDEAIAPAFIEAADRRIALLSFNCVGPEAAWATAERAGCAYVRIEAADRSPIAPSAPLERIDPHSLGEMRQVIADARKQADLVVVALHKGIVHTPARLAPYERALSHAAIDAGGDIVLGHHAHIVRGIERHRGKPIFHGLGNGCVVTRALSPTQSHPARAAWARKRRELFGFEPDPAYELAPFHPEAVHAMLGRVRVHPDGTLQSGFKPVFVEPPGRPMLAHGRTADRVIAYIERITRDAGMPALSLNRSGDDVWLS